MRTLPSLMIVANSLGGKPMVLASIDFSDRTQITQPVDYSANTINAT